MDHLNLKHFLVTSDSDSEIIRKFDFIHLLITVVYSIYINLNLEKLFFFLLKI